MRHRRFSAIMRGDSALAIQAKTGSAVLRSGKGLRSGGA
jgi:hypothetical protein